jgi:hypothetical protein
MLRGGAVETQAVPDHHPHSPGFGADFMMTIIVMKGTHTHAAVNGAYFPTAAVT